MIERYIGIPVAEAPNIASVYGRRLRLENQLFLAISQSGRSDDLVELASSAKAAGALTVAMVNATDGPLVPACDIILPIGAGPELSVAASKTFVATLAALLRLTSSWTEDESFGGAIARLPELSAAAELDWSDLADALVETTSLVTIGRGPTLAIAREASLKLKETCRLHAEAFSGAEFLHGPVALISSRCPVLMFMPTDAAAPGMRQLAAKLRAEGALLAAEPGVAARDGSRVPSDHPETDAVCLIQSFYAVLIRLAERLGTDVDRPRHLQGHAHPMSGSDRHAVIADSVFDGSRLHPDCAVVIEGSCIAALLHRSRALRPYRPVFCRLAPGSRPASSTSR